jgi:hypothetical protein
MESVRVILTEVAASRSTITYDELRVRLGDAPPGDGERDLASVLRAVSIASDEDGRGLLSAVVVRPSGLPGGGWFRLAAERGRDVSDRDQAWRTEVAAVWQAHART